MENIHRKVCLLRGYWRRYLLLTGLSAAVGLLLCGCSLSPDTGMPKAAVEETEDPFDNLISVGFSQLGSESVWRTANTASIEDSLSRENGFFLLSSNARQKQENQIKAVRGFISQRVDYIVVAPVTEEGWDTVLREARDAGIPVITSDRRVNVKDESLYTAWVGGDMEEEGRKAGQWLEETLNGKDARIGVLLGTLGSSAQLGRSAGFEKVAASHDNWEIVAQAPGEFTMAKGKEAAAAILQEHPDLNVLVSQNDDMTFGAIEAIEEAGKVPGEDILIISYDACAQALRLVDEGKISLDVECNPLLGPYLDDLLKRLEKGEEIPHENPVDEMIFTKENARDYIETRQY